MKIPEIVKPLIKNNILSEEEIDMQIQSFLDDNWKPQKLEELGAEEYNEYLCSLLGEIDEHMKAIFNEKFDALLQDYKREKPYYH